MPSSLRHASFIGAAMEIVAASLFPPIPASRRHLALHKIAIGHLVPVDECSLLSSFFSEILKYFLDILHLKGV